MVGKIPAAQVGPYPQHSIPNPCPEPYLKVMMLGCFSFRRCLMSVSFRSRTFFTATSSPWKRPRKTAPWAPEPTHCRSRISSKGTSQRSVGRRHSVTRFRESHPQGLVMVRYRERIGLAEMTQGG